MIEQLGHLTVDVEGMHARLSGRMDDSAQVGQLAARLPPGDVVIDTDGVAFVNSIGMREWMRLIRVLRDRGTVTLERVADVLMAQMNLIPEFKTSVSISSFHAQYVCPACGHEGTPLVDAVEHQARLRGMVAPAMPCPECGAKMELSDFPERYLSIFRA
ncbi:MAG TPA: hypothetical protein VGM88_33735 [Kofleriaceae bacterium]|jgi:predicted RNA-binding Zn-ribbon protein involved in translation (DUF1610 family)